MAQGYGSDIWCGDRLITGRLSRRSQTVALALYRRLITPRGMLRGGDEEGAYGFDLSAYIGGVGVPAALEALPGLVRGELLKDDRVADVAVTATIAHGADGLIDITLDISVVLAEEDEEFEFSVVADDTSTTLLGGVAEAA
jgi:hypothetical protein